MCRIRSECLRQVGLLLISHYVKDRDACIRCHKHLFTLEKAAGWKGVLTICINKAEVVKGHLSHLTFVALTETRMTNAGTGPV